MKTYTTQTSMLGKGYSRWVRLLILATILLGHVASAGAPVAPVDLGEAGDFVVLAKSGISTVPDSDITGDLGVSPIASTAITGFAMKLDSSGEFSTSSQVDGRIYAADYAEPTPTNLGVAISDMETAYSDAAGRLDPDFVELAGGSIGGLVLPPGLYSWSTDVMIDDDVVLAADADAVYIFQIEGSLTMSGNQSILLDGAQARNIFWQVAGGAGAEIGTNAHFEGVLLTQTAINVLTGASVNGKLLAQTDVNLQMGLIVDLEQINQYTLTYVAGLGGAIDGDSPQFVMKGEDGTPVTAEADPGFVFVQWSDQSTSNPRTDINVMEDITVEAEFQEQINQYTLIYTAGLGGAINGDSPQFVMKGEDGTPVTAEADPGFVFVQWSDQSTSNPRTDINVMEDITVEAEFQEQINQYTLIYTAGLGGAIDGDSPQLVMKGEDGTPVTAEADAGFEFVQWSDQSTLNPRTDLNVMADITVEAEFQESGVAVEAIGVPTLDRYGLLLLVLMLVLVGGWSIRRQA